MSQLVDGFFKMLEIILVICMISMLVMVFGNVVMRYVFHSGIELSDELSRFCFFWIIFLGSIIASRDQKHLSVDTIQQLLPKVGRKVCWAISQLIILCCCVLMFYGFWMQHEIFVDDYSPVGEVPLLLVYGVIYVSSASMGLICLNNLFRLLLGKVSESEYSMAARTE